MVPTIAREVAVIVTSFLPTQVSVERLLSLKRLELQVSMREIENLCRYQFMTRLQING